MNLTTAQCRWRWWWNTFGQTFPFETKVVLLKACFCKTLIVNRTEQEVRWPAAAKSSLKANAFRLIVEQSLSWFQPTMTTQTSVQKYTWRISAVEHLSPLPHFCIFLFPQTLQRPELPFVPFTNCLQTNMQHFPSLLSEKQPFIHRHSKKENTELKKFR